MGESGFPSAFTARPSRVRMFMPHPAGHSRHVVRYQVASPGTISSCGTTYGISRSAPPVPQAVTPAPTPVTPMTLRNSRRSSRLLIGPCSVMTDEAVGAHLAGAMTLDAPPHLQRTVLLDLPHRLHRTVAFLARKTSVEVAHVREMHVIGKPVDADPRDGPLLAPVCNQLLHFQAVRSDHRCAARNGAAGTNLHRRDAGVHRPIRRSVAVHAWDLVGASVNVVGKRDGLGDA